MESKQQFSPTFQPANRIDINPSHLPQNHEEKLDDAPEGVPVIEINTGKKYRLQNKIRKVELVTVQELTREWLSTKEVQAVYGIGRTHLERLIAQRAVKRISISGEFKYRRRDFDLYFEKAAAGKVHRAF